MTTLKELASRIQYDSSWGIWAQLIDGKFCADSQARYGQLVFENGGILDGWHYFANGEIIGDNIASYIGEFDLKDWDEFDRIVIAFEKEHGCEWGGSKKEVQMWALDCEDGEVVTLVKSARVQFEDQFEEFKDEAIAALIEEINDSLEGE